MQEGPHRELMLEAVAAEGEGHRALLAGRATAAATAYTRAADRYAASWAVAPPASYGRLVGRMKAAILAGDAAPAAADVLAVLGGEESVAASPAASYAQAMAAIVAGQDELARSAIIAMRGGSAAFYRAADALQAVIDLDAGALGAAIAAIETDFTARAEHLTGVAVADTALMAAALGAARGLAVGPGGPLRP